MSKTLSAAARQEFDSEVKHAFQTMGSGLRQTVTVRNNVVGDAYKFRKMGKGVANQKPAQADVTPMDVTHNLINCPLEDWVAPEYTDIFNAAEVNFDEQQELAFVIAAALNRRLDQQIIDAMVAETAPAGTVATSVGGNNTNLNVAKLRQASRMLNDKGVPGMDRHIAVSAQALETMLGETEVGSADYNNVKALVQGDLDTFVGFKFHIIETRDEGGLPKSGSVRTNLAWHKSAVGLAIGIDIKTEVNYVPVKTSWLANGLMKSGAVSRDGDGIVKLSCTEA